jgi:hypothetical protein
MAELKELRNFLLTGGLHHGFWDQPVKAGVRGVRDEVNRAHKDAPLIENLR